MPSKPSSPYPRPVPPVEKVRLHAAIGGRPAWPPHPAVVAQPRPAHAGAARPEGEATHLPVRSLPARPPHPATVAQPARPAHPATLAQPRVAWGGPRERPPHPATQTGRRAALGAAGSWYVQRAAAKDDGKKDFKGTAGPTATKPQVPSFPAAFRVAATEVLAGFVQNFATFAYCKVAWSESYGNGEYSWSTSLRAKNTPKTASAPARHAEANLIVLIEQQVVPRLRDDGAQHVVFFILLNNSPCGKDPDDADCTGALESFCAELEDELGAIVECSVHAASYYKEAKDQQHRRYGGLRHLSVEVHPVAAQNQDELMDAAAKAATARVVSRQMTEDQAAEWMDKKMEAILKKLGYKV